MCVRSLCTAHRRGGFKGENCASLDTSEPKESSVRGGWKGRRGRREEPGMNEGRRKREETR